MMMSSCFRAGTNLEAVMFVKCHSKLGALFVFVFIKNETSLKNEALVLMSKCFVHLSNFRNNLLINIVIYLVKKCLIIVKSLLQQSMNLILSDILFQRKLKHSKLKGYIFMSLGRLTYTCTLPHLFPRRFIPLASCIADGICDLGSKC